MKVLFVYLNQEENSFLIRNRKFGIAKMPQLGFQYLSSVLKQKGVETEIIDQSVDSFTFEELHQKIKNNNYDFLGFYSATALKNKIINWVKQLRNKDIAALMILGGPGSIGKKEYLDAGIDLVCHGEGEITVSQIVDYLNGEIKLNDIKGISYLKNGDLVDTEAQELIHNLDTLPFPDREQTPVNQYYNYHVYNMRTPFVSMMASRGCPRNCSFCCSPSMWDRRVRVRTPENVIAEIDHVVNKYHVKYISFKDDIFGINLNWLRKFCNLLIERNYDLNWMCLIHPFSFKNHREEILDLMREAGCNTLIMGLQSIDPTVLKLANRHSEEPVEAEELIKIAKRKHFLIATHFIVGLPGETETSIKANIDYALRVRPHFVEFYKLIKLEGSEIAEKYGDRETSDLSNNEISYWANFAMKKFYSHPLNLIQNLGYVLRHKPSWLFKGVRHIGYFLNSVGLK